MADPVQQPTREDRMEAALWRVIREFQDIHTLTQETEQEVLMALATDADRAAMEVAYGKQS